MPLDPTKLKIFKGDATHPQGDGIKIIAHVVNDQKKWGKGFVMALSQRWLSPQKEFLKWSGNLGDIQLVKVEPEIYVANMMCQKGLRSSNNPVPLQYDHLRTCLQKVALEAGYLNASIHMPKIGSGLAGGNFDKIIAVIDEVFNDSNIEVNIYEM